MQMQLLSDPDSQARLDPSRSISRIPPKGTDHDSLNQLYIEGALYDRTGDEGLQVLKTGGSFRGRPESKAGVEDGGRQWSRLLLDRCKSVY
jgi:hypothetical protein